MQIGLLPGLDGTGILLEPFADALPRTMSAQIVRYPRIVFPRLESFVDCAEQQLARHSPEVLVAESFSGPIAFRLVAERLRETRLLILVASFLTCPRPLPLRMASLLPLATLLRLPVPDWALRAFAYGSACSAA